jgi:hypothetical protein
LHSKGRRHAIHKDEEPSDGFDSIKKVAGGGSIDDDNVCREEHQGESFQVTVLARMRL